MWTEWEIAYVRVGTTLHEIHWRLSNSDAKYKITIRAAVKTKIRIYGCSIKGKYSIDRNKMFERTLIEIKSDVPSMLQIRTCLSCDEDEWTGFDWIETGPNVVSAVL